MLNKETVELLKGLKVEVKNFLITNNKEPFKLVTVGGYEVLQEKLIKDLTEEELKVVKTIGKGEMIDSKEKLLPFIYIEDLTLDIKNMHSILSVKGKKSLSKEEALTLNKSIGNTQALTDSSKAVHNEPRDYDNRPESSGLFHDLPTKEELEDKIVYIFEENPSTNSLALAKQFDIRADNVLQNLMNIISLYPSIINGIKVKSYLSQIRNDSILYYLYYEINEEIYNKFINSMGEPKSVGMKLYRTKKKEEYFKGFQNLRQELYNNGSIKKEVEKIITEKKMVERKHNTVELIKASYNFITHYNSSRTDGEERGVIFLNKVIFNIINEYVGIDSVSFSSNNRNNAKGKILELLVKTEQSLALALNAVRGNVANQSLRKTILEAFHLSLFTDLKNINEVEDKIISMLYRYNAVSDWRAIDGWKE